MITTGWEAVRRPHDEEIVGYLMADGPLAVPVTLAGQPLGPAQDANAATALLVGHGLAALARRWWCRLPEPLPRGVLAAGHPLPGVGLARGRPRGGLAHRLPCAPGVARAR